jgi:malate dehydrogenase (oxaloacetate-decarboxylating)(NADP+)
MEANPRDDDDLRERALEYHRRLPHGKIEVRPTKPSRTQSELSLAYSPGVAAPCREIASDPDSVFDYTARGNLVGIVTNGTAVLGLGDIGPLAGKPVMEGKAVLFKKFAGIDVFDIEIDAKDVDAFCTAVAAIAPTFGGINIEDVKAPECFEIERRLQALDVPVFHDDQHGTAIIICAGLLNALELARKKVDEIRLVFSGAGAAAIATARLVQSIGVRKEQIVLCDSKGVVHEGRADVADNRYKAEFAQPDRGLVTLADALVDADVFIGVSKGGLVTPDMLRSMAASPIVFALANPDPEIAYPLAREARPDAIVATGRTDFPNQVNNVLGFPYIFRGALDTRATGVTEEMKVAAIRALASLAREDVEDSVSEAYGGQALRFGPEYIIPKPVDPRVLLCVAPAVAEAATRSGVARRPIADIEAYRRGLERLLGKEHQIRRFVFERSRARTQRIAFADGENERVLRAAAALAEEGSARAVLVGRLDRIQERIAEGAIRGLELVEGDVPHDAPSSVCRVVDPTRSEYRPRFEARLLEERCRKGMTPIEAIRRMRTPEWFTAMLVAEGHADGLVSGLQTGFVETLRPALQTLGTAEGHSRVFGVHMMTVGDDVYFFADTTVIVEPTAEEMAEMACATADLARLFEVEPRVAMVSFSNFGSVRDPRAAKVRRATELVRERCPDLEVEGEMHVDLALLPEAKRELYPFARLTDKANVLVFPSLEAGNAAQKVLQCTAADATIGPILVGLAHPVSIVPPYATTRDLVLSAGITALMAGAVGRSRLHS